MRVLLLSFSLVLWLAQAGYANSTVRLLWEKSADSDSDRFCIAVLSDCLGLIDSSGRVVVRFDPPRRDHGDFFAGRMAMYDPATGKFGYVDEEGEWAILPRFDVARPFEGGLAVVREESGNPWRLVDREGNLVGPQAEYGIQGLRNGLGPVRPSTDELAGYVDASGDWAIPQRFRAARAFSEDDGLAAVWEPDGDWGYIDVDGRYSIPPTLLQARSFRNGRAAVIIEGPCLYRIDADPIHVSPRRFITLRPTAGSGVSSIQPVAMPECRMRMINTDGKVVSAHGFQFLGEASPDGASAKVAEMWGIVGLDGEWVTPPVWDEVRPFSEGLAAVYKRGTGWGFVDRLGVVVIDLAYAKVGRFSEGLAVVLDAQRRSTYILPNGKRAFDREFLHAGPFRRGMAHVMTGENEWEYIDSEGRTVFRYSRDGKRR